jgi:hypothetical protein
MKSFTRIGLPILVVVAAVFGITFVRVYSPDEQGQKEGPKPKAAKSAGKEVLTFPIVTVAPMSGKPDAGRESLALWDPEIEVGVSGHFEFWALNKHPEPVTARVFDVNCQCAGVEVTSVDHGAFRDYAAVSALAGSPLCPAPGPLAAFAHAAFSQRLQWTPLLANAERHDQMIPGADPSLGSQLAIFRLGWTGKPEQGSKYIKAYLLAGTGDDHPTGYTLEVTTVVVPAFDLIRRDGVNGWAPVPDLSLGELRENGEAAREIYLVSTTRRQLVFRFAVDHPDPCLTWTEPVPASDEEVNALSEFVVKNGGTNRRPKSLYKFQVSLRERTEAQSGGKSQFHQLDLGLLDHRLGIEAIGAGKHVLPVKARVLGDVDLLSGAPDGRLDLGDSFAKDQDRTKDVVIVADRPGLNLTLSTAETTPNYLKVKLEPLEQIDGRNRWRLWVTVPKGKLVGALPAKSEVILTTSGPNPRKLRIPVRGQAYDSGGNRI